MKECEVLFLLRQSRDKVAKRGEDGQPDVPAIAMAGAEEHGVANQSAIANPFTREAQHRFREDQTNAVLQALAQPIAPVVVAISVLRVPADPDGPIIPQLDGSRRSIIRPKIKRPTAGHVEARMVPVAGENTVLNGAAMQRETKMRATVV
jgi:hypothetical protein